MRAIIIGAGIGGLTAALALRRVGIDCTVYERAPELREVGAGISLWPNAVRALEAMGAAGPVLAGGARMRVSELRAASGRVLMRQDNLRAFERELGPLIIIHRAELVDALHRQLRPGTVRFGRTFMSLDQDEAGVTARFEGGETDSADVLIGADGLNSAARTCLVGPDPPRYAGYTCYRGVCEFPLEGPVAVSEGFVAEVWGRGQRFGITRIPPLSPGRPHRVYWWATWNAHPGGTDAEPAEVLRERYRSWAEPVRSIIQATPASAMIRNDIYDRPPLPPERWCAGRVVLLGDAAHPTTPNLGQGGCMAIEDAAVLARHLRDVNASSDLGAGEVASALLAFAKERSDRTARVTRASWRLGSWGQWSNPILCGVRDLTCRLTPGRVGLSMLERYARFDPGVL